MNHHVTQSVRGWCLHRDLYSISQRDLQSASCMERAARLCTGSSVQPGPGIGWHRPKGGCREAQGPGGAQSQGETTKQSSAVLEEAARELAPGTESAHQAAWQWVVRVCTHYVPAGCGLCVKRSKRACVERDFLHESDPHMKALFSEQDQRAESSTPCCLASWRGLGVWGVPVNSGAQDSKLSPLRRAVLP